MDWELIKDLVLFGLNCVGLGFTVGFMAAYWIFRSPVNRPSKRND